MTLMKIPNGLKDEDIIKALEKMGSYVDVTVDDFMKLYNIVFELMMNRFLKEVKVRDLMNPQVIYTSPEEDIKEVIIKMAEAGISGLPVVEDGKVIGVISERDILSGLNLKPAGGTLLLLLLFMKQGEEIISKLLEKKVKDLMTSPAIVLSEEAPIEQAILLMRTKGLNRIPVINGHHRLVGIITREDLILKHPLFRGIFYDTEEALEKDNK